MKSKFKFYAVLLILSFTYTIHGQTVDVKYLNPKFVSSQYTFLRIGNSSNYFAGIMHNISNASYGDGNDVSLFTYGNRDLSFNTGTGNVIIFPSSGGNVGIGTKSPSTKLDVNGTIKGSELEISRNLNNDWVTKMYNGGGDGLGLLVQSGYGGSQSSNVGTILQLEDGNNSVRMKVQSNGKVGIGTANPSTQLDVNGTIKGSELEISRNLNNDWVTKMYNGGGDGLGLLVQSGYGGSQSSNVGTILQLEDGTGNLRLKVQSNGKVGIGTTDIPNGYKLAVGGKVISEEVTVQLQGQWPDFVFKNTYNLPNLAEVEKHISEKGYLQNIPSEKEVKENGVNLGEMDAKLLQKIEELMLYTIQQQKEIEELKTLNIEMQKVIQTLK